VISIVENSNKFQKPNFWKEKLIKDVATRLNAYHSIQVKGIIMCPWCCWKDFAIGYKYALQNNVICCVNFTL
jgi:hypothetical protein